MVLDKKRNEISTSKSSKFFSDLQLFWKNFQKNWLWVNIGAIIMNTFFMWILYFNNLSRLGFTIGITIGYPLAIILWYFLKNIKSINSLIVLNKIILVGVVGFVITDIIMLFLMYVVFTGPRAPLDQRSIPNWLGYIILSVSYVLIHSIAGYFLYRFGKKREWHISVFY